ncbi:MAG: glycosyltransferase [Candidatus Baldrarchaeia archaeon]
MKIVVGILNKDCDQQLRRCLDSLLNQSFKDFEVVVVDGGSKDNSLEILQEYSKKDKRIHYFIQRSKGTGMARNELVTYVREYFPDTQKIVWGDAENVYDHGYLQNIVAENVDIVGGMNIIDSREPLSQSLWWYYNGWQGGAISGNNECIDIKIYRKHQYVDVIRGEDLIFHQKLVAEGYKLNHCSQAICYIKTVESFGDLINWTKRKARGLFQWANREGMLLSLFRRYLFFNILVWVYILFFFVLVLIFPFLVMPYLLPPFMLSTYFWQKGKFYTRGMKKTTFFYFIPVLLTHFSVMFFEILKLRFLKTSLLKEPL